MSESRYEEIKLEGFYELVHGGGNICLKEGKLFIHLYLVLGDRDGKACVGRLLRGELLVARS